MSHDVQKSATRRSTRYDFGLMGSMNGSTESDRRECLNSGQVLGTVFEDVFKLDDSSCDSDTQTLHLSRMHPFGAGDVYVHGSLRMCPTHEHVCK